MKKPVLIAFFSVFIATFVLAVPKADALIMVRNYSRYTSTFVDPMNQTDGDRARWRLEPIAVQEKKDASKENAGFFQSILNFFK